MFKPLGNKVVVKEPAVDEIHSSGLIISGGASDQMQCEVVATGDGEYDAGILIPPTVVVGDTVLLQKGFGQKLTFEGEKYIIVTEPEVIGII